MSPRTIVKPIVIETPVTTPDPAVTPAAVTTDPAVPTVAIPVTGVGVDSWLVDFARVPSITIGVDPASMTCIFGKEAKSTNETKRNHILWVLLALTSAPTSARGLEYRKWVASNEASLQANYGKYFVHIDYHDSSVMVATQFQLKDIVPTIAKQYTAAFGPSVREYGLRASKARSKGDKQGAPVEFDL